MESFPFLEANFCLPPNTFPRRFLLFEKCLNSFFSPPCMATLSSPPCRQSLLLNKPFFFLRSRMTFLSPFDVGRAWSSPPTLQDSVLYFFRAQLTTSTMFTATDEGIAFLSLGTDRNVSPFPGARDPACNFFFCSTPLTRRSFWGFNCLVTCTELPDPPSPFYHEGTALPLPSFLHRPPWPTANGSPLAPSEMNLLFFSRLKNRTPFGVARHF